MLSLSLQALFAHRSRHLRPGGLQPLPFQPRRTAITITKHFLHAPVGGADVLGDVFDSKAEHSALRLSGDEVDEIDFAGKEMAITFHLSAEQGAATNTQRRNEDGE